MLYPVNDALEMLSIGRTRFYEEVAAGRITIVKSGKKSLVPHKSLVSYVESKVAETQAARVA